MAKRPSKPSAKRPGFNNKTEPVPVEQGSWLYTIAFSLAVVAFVIGIYQTMVEQDLASNYWLFMIAAGLMLLIRWDRLRRERKEPTK